ncbi:MAG: hypothetical protein ABWW65_06435, partial [Thermoprotei archaeon]
LLYILYSFEKILLYPLIIIEETGNGSVIAIDYGQLIVLGLLYVWRRRVIRCIRLISRRILLYPGKK